MQFLKKFLLNTKYIIYINYLMQMFYEVCSVMVLFKLLQIVWQFHMTYL